MFFRTTIQPKPGLNIGAGVGADRNNDLFLIVLDLDNDTSCVAGLNHKSPLSEVNGIVPPGTTQL